MTDAASRALLLPRRPRSPRPSRADAQAKARLDTLLAGRMGESRRRESPPLRHEHRRPPLRRPPALGRARRTSSGARPRRAACSSACRRSTRTALAPAGPRQPRHARARAPRRPRAPPSSATGAHPDQRRQRLPHRLSRAARRTCRSPPSKDYENYIARLRAFPRLRRRSRSRTCARGCARGFTLPRVALDGYDVTMRAARRGRSREERLLDAVRERSRPACPRPSASGCARPGRDGDREGRGRRPTATLLDFMTKEYVPGARTTLGASELPDGRDVLRAPGARHFTTLDVTPEAGPPDRPRRGRAHPRARWTRSCSRSGFQGDFAAFLEFLRTDPRFYAKTPEELLKQASWIAKRMDGKLPSLFGRLPRLPYSVEPVPADLAPEVHRRPLRRRPGRRHARRAPTGSTPTRSRAGRSTTLEALTLHEAVPGHHLQIALAQELHGRARRSAASATSTRSARAGASTPSGSGLEAGFYQDPYSNFGRLTYEMWRACRLVVDTGIHAHGLDAPAGDRLHGRATPRSRCTRSTTEIDRYISWPGQALAYKMGELKIRELRARAEKAARRRASTCARSTTPCSRNGSVPLDVLEEQIDEFIASRRATSARPSP